VYVASRLVLWGLALTALAVLDVNPRRGPWDTARLHDVGDWVDVWARWDANWFLRIAEEGYSWPSVTPAFFPLYPALVGGLGRVLGGHYVLAGVIVSLVAGAVAAVLLERVARARLGPSAARRATLYLAVAPTSFFLGAVYSEATFLALALGCFVLAERGRLGWAGAVAGLALLTRAQGVALLPALAVFAWRSPARGRAFASVALAPAVFSAYPLLLWAWIDRPFAFLEAEDVWGRSLSPLGPLGGLWQTVTSDPVGWRWGFELATAVVVLPLVVVVWRLLGATYGLYAAAAVAIPLSFPSDRLGGLYSLPRFALAVFPVFLVLGWAGQHRRVHLATGAVFGAAACVCVVLWATWTFVA
jgi:hypothetical protein